MTVVIVLMVVCGKVLPVMIRGKRVEEGGERSAEGEKGKGSGREC